VELCGYNPHIRFLLQQVCRNNRSLLSFIIIRVHFNPTNTGEIKANTGRAREIPTPDRTARNIVMLSARRHFFPITVLYILRQIVTLNQYLLFISLCFTSQPNIQLTWVVCSCCKTTCSQTTTAASNIILYVPISKGAWSRLRRYATSRKVPGSIPGRVTGDFIFRSIRQVHVPGVDSASLCAHNGILFATDKSDPQ
jgi:hypothetical protein